VLGRRAAERRTALRGYAYAVLRNATALPCVATAPLRPAQPPQIVALRVKAFA